MPANLFQLATNDQSLYYLGEIFGNISTVLPSASRNYFMGGVFQVLNTIALTVGSIIVVYTTVVGLMMTAHEGEFLGKKWSGLWVPIRMVLGVASLFPATSGYSAIQVIFMWIIVQGVGAADMLWTTAIDHKKMSTREEMISTDAAGSLAASFQMENIFKGLVCEQSVEKMDDLQRADGLKPFALLRTKGNEDSHYTIGDQVRYRNIRNALVYKGLRSTKVEAFEAGTFKMGPGGHCGVLKTCDPDNKKKGPCKDGVSADDIACNVCKAQKQVLSEIIPAMRPYAKAIVNNDFDYIMQYFFHVGTFKEKGNSPEKPTTPEWISDYVELHGWPALKNDDAEYPYANMAPQEAELIANSNSLFAPPEVQEGVESSESDGETFLQGFTDQYTAAIQAAVTPPGQETTSAAETQGGEDWEKKTKQDGWITAGAFYYRLVGSIREGLEDLNYVTFEVENPEPRGAVEKSRNNYEATDYLLGYLANQNRGPSGAASISSVSGSSKAGRLAKKGGSMLVKNFMKGIDNRGDTYGTDKFLGVARFGQNFLMTGQILYVTFMGVNIIASYWLGLTTWKTGLAGYTQGPKFEAGKALMQGLAPLILMICGAMITAGALLGMYLPMIPFVVFTVSVIGWFIAVIEAMVAAPLVALGILSPGGQSEVFGRAEPAVMIMFNLFLRPSLLVVGLLTAMFLANQIITFINYGFGIAMAGAQTRSMGAVEAIIYLAIYVSLLLTAMNQVFTLIHHVPERVLTFIGGQAMQYGEAQATGAMKQAAEGAAGAAAGGLKGGGEAAGAAGTGIAKAGAEGELPAKGDVDFKPKGP